MLAMWCSLARKIVHCISLTLDSYVSPRHRAQRTLELLSLNCRSKFPWQDERTHSEAEVRTEAKVEITGAWSYTLRDLRS